MAAPHTSLMIVAAPGVPTPTRGDDPAALLTGPLGTLQWPDLSTGIRLGDIVSLDEAFVSVCEGNLVKSGTKGATDLPGRPGLATLPLGDPARTAGEIRRGLDARFGGRPGVLIGTAAAGLDASVGKADFRGGLEAISAILREAYPGHPAVVIRGVGQFLTYEDEGF